MTISVIISPEITTINAATTFTVSAGFDLYCIEFGDGQVSYTSATTHTYTEPGEYTVKVAGCNSDGTGREDTSRSILVLNEGESICDFYVKPRYGQIPLTVMFINESPATTDSFLWDFGDGTTSTDRNPVHTYANAQSYTVKLTSTEGSTSETIVKKNYIRATETAPPEAVFTHDLTDNTGEVPKKVTFTDASTGTITTSSWDFGDGAISTETSPVHTYARPGYYFVKRIVSNADYEDILTVLFYIRPKAAIIRIASDVSTGPDPLTITVTPIIIGPYKRLQWDFGDDVTADTYSASHTYTTPGTYTVTLTVWNSTALYPATGTKTITVINSALLPVAAFSANVTSGAFPLSVTFTDATTNTPTAWSWNFGDGSLSVLQNPTHTYTVPGVYTVTLTATNATGTDTETKTGYIIVTAAPVAVFSPDTDIHHLSHQFVFTDESEYLPTSWLWDFGDGTTSTSQNPTHTFSAAKSYWVTLTVTNATGSDAIGMDITVLPAGYPIPNFTSVVTGTKAPYTVRFTDASLGTPTSWLWDFGDGETSVLQNPTHTYSYEGTYTVTLTVTNTAGTATTYMRVIDGD